MHRKKEPECVAEPAVLAILLAASAWAALAVTGAGAFPEGSADRPTPTSPGSDEPVRRISGVIAIPPEQMMGKREGGNPSGPLTLPTFGPDVDASLNDPFNQNETTVVVPASLIP